MNPLKWVRWKIVIALLVISGGLYFLGLNPLARWQINDLGSSGRVGARFKIKEAALGLLVGRASFDGFELATPRQPPPGAEARERVAQADEMVCDLGMDDLLRKRFAVDELSVTRPLLRIERRADGTINVSELGSTEPEKPAGKPTDWVKALEEWMEKIKKRVEERRKQEAGKGQEPPVAKGEKKEGARADYSKRVAYPFEKNPRAVVRKLKAAALEIQFDDQTGALKPPPIKDAQVEILNLSDRPEHYPDPILISIAGKIENAPIKISGTIDLRRIAETGVQKNDLLLQVEARGVPLQQVVQVFAGDSLEATFEKGTADLNAEIRLTDLEKLAVRAPAAGQALFALHGVQMKARPGSRIAGVDGEKFCRAVNEVGDLEFKELEIGGTLHKPEFKWGGINELIASGGKAFAQKQAQKGIEQGTQKAQELIDRELKKNPDLKKALPGVDLKAPLESGASGALQGLFGKKKPSEPAPEPKKTP